jgi:MFS family permease
MHSFDDVAAPPKDDPTDTRPWYKLLNSYHWFVLLVAALGWLFDCLDQQLFILARPAVMKELILDFGDPVAVKQMRGMWSDIATSVFIAGWATGGLFFGMLGDRIGRARTMIITILLYSIFTGLSAFSTSVWDFSFYRFLTGLGVGGEFAVGVALVAEVMPARARPYTLALLQALSAIGNISAALINWGLGVAEEQGMETSPWRIMFMIGALPALLALVIRGRLKEPEKWKAVSEKGMVDKQLGSYSELFGDPRWRKHALLGLLLAVSGVVGLWAVGFYSPDLTRFVLRKQVAAQVYEEQIAQSAGDSARVTQLEQLRDLEANASTSAGAVIPTELEPVATSIDKVISGRLAFWQSMTAIAQNVGAFFGMFGFGLVAQRIGRKPTFAIALVAAFISTVTVFALLNDFWQIFVLVPIMGFCQLSLFAGYAIYFPELFPTRLRSTGTSFCYNVGRFVAATGPLLLALLRGAFVDTAEPLRWAGVTMCTVFLLGLMVLPFLPETRGKPLPE